MVGEERMLVSDIPGTSRDAVDTLLVSRGRRYVLVDTAGMRRKGRLDKAVESLSVMRARQAMASPLAKGVLAARFPVPGVVVVWFWVAASCVETSGIPSWS